MNISPGGYTVRFKTEPKELFEAEKSGTKPNTVRILDIDEYHQLRKHNPKKIIIQYRQEFFLRTITNVHATKVVFGKVIVVISWTNDKPPIVGPHSVPVEPGSHNASVGDDPEVPATSTICRCIDCIRCINRVMGNEIKDDFHVHTMSPDKLAPVLLPLTLIHDLGRFRHGLSHADFIRELLLEHLNKLAEERGPMHD
jgi:hypothetical protein